MSLEIAWKQNILVTDSNLLKSLLVVFGFGSQAFVCGISRQNIGSVVTSWLESHGYNVLVRMSCLEHPGQNLECPVWLESFYSVK